MVISAVFCGIYSLMSFQKKPTDIPAIKIKEVQWFIELMNAGSVRELARRKSVQPGQVSKVIKSLEKKVDTILFERSISGVHLTLEGRKILPALQELIYAGEKIEALRSKQGEEFSKQLTVASTSFLTTNVVSKLISNPIFDKKKYRFTLINLVPDDFVQTGILGGFDLCFHVGSVDWPKTWHSQKIATLGWSLYARKKHPIHDKPTERHALKYPFVFPVYLSKEGLFEGNDLCPVPRAKRTIGHQTTTARSAFEIIQETDHLAFLPEVIATNRKVEKVMIKSWPKVTKNIYATVKEDLVQKKDFDKMIELFCKTLEKAR